MEITQAQKASKAKQQVMAEKRATRERKESFLGKGHYIKKAQAAFNSYIRERDYRKPCISSGREMDWNKFGGAVDAGHYRSTGSAPHLRFCLWNCHAQSVHDNRHLSGNNADYRIHLIARIGLGKVEEIDSNNEKKNYSIDYLKRIAKIFRKRANVLKKRRL